MTSRSMQNSPDRIYALGYDDWLPIAKFENFGPHQIGVIFKKLSEMHWERKQQKLGAWDAPKSSGEILGTPTHSTKWVINFVVSISRPIRKIEYKDNNYFGPRRSDHCVFPQKASKLKRRDLAAAHPEC